MWGSWCWCGACLAHGINRLERVTDLPVGAVGIGDAADSPAVAFADWPHFAGARSDGAVEGRIGIGNREDDPNRRAVQRLGAEVQMLGRLIGYPELSAVHRKPRHDGVLRAVEPIYFHRSECALIEFDRLGTAPH